MGDAVIVRPAPPSLCADTVIPLNDDGLDALYAYGVRAIGRYLENLTADELQRILAHRMGLFVIGEAHAPNTWMPNAEIGKQDAARHLAKLRALGIPQGAAVVLDCETPNPSSLVTDRIAWIDAWGRDVVGQYQTVSYVGANMGMTSDEWYLRPAIRRYAKACSMLRDRHGNAVEPARGFAWVQALPPNIRVGPAIVDLGLLASDYRGDTLACVYQDA